MLSNNILILDKKEKPDHIIRMDETVMESVTFMQPQVQIIIIDIIYTISLTFCLNDKSFFFRIEIFMVMYLVDI